MILHTTTGICSEKPIWEEGYNMKIHKKYNIGHYYKKKKQPSQ